MRAKAVTSGQGELPSLLELLLTVFKVKEFLLSHSVFTEKS